MTQKTIGRGVGAPGLPFVLDGSFSVPHCALERWGPGEGRPTLCCQTLVSSLGQGAQRSLRVLGTVSTVGMLLHVPRWGVATRGHTPCSTTADWERASGKAGFS